MQTPMRWMTLLTFCLLTFCLLTFCLLAALPAPGQSPEAPQEEAPEEAEQAAGHKEAPPATGEGAAARPRPRSWPIVDLSGRWYSNFGYMELTQEERGIEGTYSCCDGTITGTLKGPKLRRAWRQTRAWTSTNRRSAAGSGSSPPPRDPARCRRDDVRCRGSG